MIACRAGVTQDEFIAEVENVCAILKAGKVWSSLITPASAKSDKKACTRLISCRFFSFYNIGHSACFRYFFFRAS
ncbi:hypothetical protein J5839_01200 [Methanosarcinaceae archaeon]|nr:hypothetical protein [Methanosarcinaceae archaeon]